MSAHVQAFTGSAITDKLGALVKIMINETQLNLMNNKTWINYGY
jgi:hypothetical protein